MLPIMKITFEKDLLLTTLAPVLGAVSSRNTMPTIAGILFKTVDETTCALYAYDLEKGIKTTISCVVEREGSFILNANKFVSIVRSLPDDSLTVDINEKNLVRITSGRSEFGLHALKGSDFPNLPELGGDNPFLIKQKLLRSLIGKTLFSAAQGDAKAIFNGVYFKTDTDSLTAVSSDRFTLSVCRMNAEIRNRDNGEEIHKEFIIPAKTLSEVYKLLDDTDDEATVFINRKHTVFMIGNYILFSRLIDGEYIDYERFMPKESKTFVSLDTAEFAQTLERAALVTEDRELGQKKSILRCSFEPTVVKLSTESVSGRFLDEVFCQKTGDDLVIFFTCKRLLDAVRATNVERLHLDLNTNLTGMVLTPAEPEKEFPDGEFRILVLPVRPPQDGEI